MAIGTFRGIVYRPLGYLNSFHKDRIKFPNRAIVAGYGGGKTYAVCMENILVSEINRGVPNVIIEPTFLMVRDILIPTLTDILDLNHIKYEHNKSHHNFYIPEWNGHIWLRSGDKPDKLKGMNAGLVTIDEPFIQSKAVYDVAISRSRNPKAKILGIVLSGTPENLNWGFDIIEDEKEEFKLYSGTTYDNFYLPESYVKKLEASYGEKDAAAYIRGQFVDRTTGQCYYSFGQDNIIPNYTPVPSRPIEVSCDFNIDIMCWNIGQEVGGIDYTFDSVEMTGTAKTEVMCQMVRAKLNTEYKDRYSDVIFYCDIAGSANRPEAAYTNIEIIRNNFPGARIETRHIANIGDRISATNARLRDSNGNIRAYVTGNCKRLINDYRRVNWDHFFKKGSAGDLTHTSDGESYKFFAKYPLTGRVEVTRRSIH